MSKWIKLQNNITPKRSKTNPSGQRDTVGQNLTANERSIFSSGLLKAVDVMRRFKTLTIL